MTDSRLSARQFSGVFCAAFLAFAACTHSSATPEPVGAGSSAGARVVVGTPKRMGLAPRLKVAGFAAPYEETVIYSRVSGYVEEVPIDRGTRVRKGDILARLSAPELLARSSEADASLKEATAALGMLRRIRSESAGAVTDEELLRAEATEQRARARRDEAAALAGYLTIRAPFDGVITKRFVHPGALVEGNDAGASPLFRLVNDMRLRIVVDVPETESPYVEPGKEALFRADGLPDAVMRAPVVRVSSSLADDTRTMKVELDFDNEEHLILPGTFVRVELPLRTIENAMVVPARWVRYQKNEPYLLLVEDGKARKTPVRAGRDDGRQVQILEGVPEAARIIAKGPPSLADGDAVEVMADDLGDL